MVKKELFAKYAGIPIGQNLYSLYSVIKGQRNIRN